MPNMIGSETFIIVAFRCSENSTPCARASSICASTKADSALALITAASISSPAFTFTPVLSMLRRPSAPTSSMETLPACSICADCSLP